MVPKAITLTLVNHSKENLQRELLQELYKPDVLEDLLKESELVVARRKEVVGMVQALNKAEEYVSFPFMLRGRVFNFTLFQDCGRCVRRGLWAVLLWFMLLLLHVSFLPLV
jgi:Dynamin GTPase effector domain